MTVYLLAHIKDVKGLNCLVRQAAQPLFIVSDLAHKQESNVVRIESLFNLAEDSIHKLLYALHFQAGNR